MHSFSIPTKFQHFSSPSPSPSPESSFSDEKIHQTLHLRPHTTPRPGPTQAIQHAIFSAVVREARAAAHTGSALRDLTHRFREPPHGPEPQLKQGVPHGPNGHVALRAPRVFATLRRRNENDATRRGAHSRPPGNPVSFTEEEPFSELEESYGATKGKRKVAMSFLENRLDEIGDVVNDDFVRSFLLYTIGTFLPSNDGKVDSRFLKFFEELEEVAGFAWASVVVDDLCQWLDKRKENNVQYVGGCLIFLQTWSYEHFDVAARPQLQDHDLTFPRVCRWDNSKSIPRQRGTSWFKDLDDDQVIWKLQPTSVELQIEIIKDALELLGDNKELRSAESCSTSTPSSVPDVDSGSQLSINNEVHKMDEADLENQVVEDTPTRSSICDEEYREQINLENLIVLETPPDLTICDEVHIEQINLENLIVLETPPDLTICDEVHIERENNLEKLVVVVEDTPTSASVADDIGEDQELNGEILIVEDTPPQSSFNDDDLRKENGTLEEITELKMTLGQVMEENEQLRSQVLSNTQLEKHNAELKKELELLREENRNLRLSISSFGDRLERHILDFESNTTE